MPAAGHTISTTRITLPEPGTVKLERVDAGRIRLEHAHMSLVFMTTLMQAVIGSLTFILLHGANSAVTFLLLLVITSVALNISVFHLGRPAYAWRAMKMWRRSWLSREVLLFGLFFGALAFFFALSLPASIRGLHSDTFPRLLYGLRLIASSKFFPFVGWSAVVLGLAGTIASAFIYLVPARPSWNMVHTPLDFLLSAALIGSLLPSILQSLGGWSLQIAHLGTFISTAGTASFAAWPVAAAATLWLANQIVRRLRLNFSSNFERRATASLLETGSLHPLWIASLATVAASALFAGFDHNLLACLSASAGILLSRYLFFVSVVPLNMALTFVRGGHN
jgi:formate dehydrogenase iron-sulfur subunit